MEDISNYYNLKYIYIFVYILQLLNYVRKLCSLFLSQIIIITYVRAYTHCAYVCASVCMIYIYKLNITKQK